MNLRNPRMILFPSLRSLRSKSKIVSARAPLQRTRSRVKDMISAIQRMAYTRRSDGQAFKPAPKAFGALPQSVLFVQSVVVCLSLEKVKNNY
jgi:hypothetical protein